MAVTLRDTADIRAKILNVWKLVDEKKITVTEARLHMGLARTILETLRVEIMAAHLTQSQLPSVSILGKSDVALPLTPPRRQ
jgi:hypothetical protein